MSESTPSPAIYRILFLEDNEDDVELMQNELHEAGIPFASRHIRRKKDFLSGVNDFQPNIILADYSLPMFNGMDAFNMIKKTKRGIPFILVTGVLSEQMALECLKEGVDDFILKSSFKRLPSALVNAISKKEVEKEKERIAGELRQSHEELRLLLKKQQIAREDERMNIARDLHDELGQLLTALKIDITMFRKKLSADASLMTQARDAELVEMTQLVDHITQSLKRIAAGLRPSILDDLDVLDSIRSLCQDFATRSDLEFEIDLPTVPPELNKDVSIALFRIVQETLTNVARHAQARKVTVQLQKNDGILDLTVADNGRGIRQDEISSSSSLGLIGLRERIHSFNGKFEISGKPSQGTTVHATIPLEIDPAPYD